MDRHDPEKLVDPASSSGPIIDREYATGVLDRTVAAPPQDKWT